jgi:hypothetical protein
MAKLCRVYSICFGGGKANYLRVEKEGTRAECDAFIRGRTRANLPTHYMHISSLDFQAAEKKFLP